MLFMVFFIPWKTEVIITSPVSISTPMLTLKKKSTLPIKIIESGLKCVSWVLQCRANFLQIEQFQSIAVRFGILNLFQFHTLQLIQIHA